MFLMILECFYDDMLGYRIAFLRIFFKINFCIIQYFITFATKTKTKNESIYASTAYCTFFRV